jgi:hypothetical protein
MNIDDIKKSIESSYQQRLEKQKKEKERIWRYGKE